MFGKTCLTEVPDTLGLVRVGGWGVKKEVMERRSNSESTWLASVTLLDGQDIVDK